MFIDALFVISQICKNPKANEQLNEQITCNIFTF